MKKKILQTDQNTSIVFDFWTRLEWNDGLRTFSSAQF